MKENMYIKCNQMLLAEDRFNMDSFLKTWLQMWPTSWTQCLRKKSLYVQSFRSSSMFFPSLLTHKKCFLELEVTHPPLSHFQHKNNSSMPLSKQSWTCYWEKKHCFVAAHHYTNCEEATLQVKTKSRLSFFTTNNAYLGLHLTYNLIFQSTKIVTTALLTGVEKLKTL